LHTADLVHLGDDDVFIVGRTDDVFVIRWRNIDARSWTPSPAPIPRLGPATRRRCSTTRALRRRGGAQQPGGRRRCLREAAREIRVALVSRFSASPSALIFIDEVPSQRPERQDPENISGALAQRQLAEVVSG